MRRPRSHPQEFRGHRACYPKAGGDVVADLAMLCAELALSSPTVPNPCPFCRVDLRRSAPCDIATHIKNCSPRVQSA